MTTKSFINHRVLWLLIPLLMLFNNSVFGTGTATLPFEWTVATDNSSTISDPSGVTENSIGRYTSNYPYRLKFDAQGDYLQIDVDAAVDKVIFHVKMVGGTSTSKFKVQGCTTSSGTYSDVEEFTISGSSNTTVVNCTTSVAISSTYRYIRIIKSVHGSNVGLGYVKITKAAPAVKYTVTYNAEGGTCGTASATESTAGGGVTLPSASPSSACSSDGWAFYGWATSACGSVTAAAPEIVGTTDDTYHPTSNTTLHAVYRKSLGSSNYNRIVSLDDLSSGSDYIFVGEYSSANYVMTNSYSTSGDYGRFAGSQINESSTGMYSAASINSNYKLTITGTTDNYYIYCAANSKYVDVGYKAMIYGSKDPADYYQIIVSNGKWKTINHYNSNYILYDGSNNIFKGSSTEYELLIYKYGPSYSYYSSPSCCTPLGSINGSISLSKGKSLFRTFI